jgi:hypothetical protein
MKEGGETQGGLEELGTLTSKNKGVGSFEGVEYKFEYFSGGKNAPPSLKVIVDCPSTGSFQTAKETKFDRFFKKWGLCAEINTGDLDFDQRFFIRTNTVNFTRLFFEAPEKRQAVTEIHERDFKHIIHDGKTMAAVKSPYNLKDGVDRKLVEEVVAQMGVLSKRVPSIAETGTSNWKVIRFVMFAIPALIYLTGMLTFVFGLVYFEPLDFWDLAAASLKFSIPVMVIFWWISALLLKGRSTSHREWFIIWITSLFLYPFAGASYMMFLNGYRDQAPAMSNQVMVVDKRISKSDKSTSYHAFVESWRDPNDVEKIDVSERDYPRIQPEATKMTVTTKPGRFGYEWIKEYRLETGK